MPIFTVSATSEDGVGTPGVPLHTGRVALGTVTLGETDDLGVEWMLERLSGWDDTGSTGTWEQRASDHGGWASPAFLPPRIVTVEGSLVAGSYAGASRALDRLKAAVPLSGFETLTVVESDDRTLQAEVRQEGELLSERAGGWARFSLSLLAPDPRKYATAVSSSSTGLPSTSGGLSLPLSMPFSVNATVTSGVIVATNDGNMATRPTLKLYGPTPPDTRITHRGTGQTIRVPEAVPAGRFLLLDVDNRRALLDGTAARRVTGAWFDYAPGDNEIALSAPTYDPAALLVSEHRSAWR